MWNLFHICIYFKTCPYKNKGGGKDIGKENLNIDVPHFKRSYIRFFISGGEKLISKCQSWKYSAVFSLCPILSISKACSLQILGLWMQHKVWRQTNSKLATEGKYNTVIISQKAFPNSFLYHLCPSHMDMLHTKWKLVFYFCFLKNTTIWQLYPNSPEKEIRAQLTIQPGALLSKCLWQLG